MKKILVIGSGGSGKSTFANGLDEILHLGVVHLDSLYWNPGWVETPKADWIVKIDEVINRGSWIMDGNYSGTLEVRLKACDSVIFLDLTRTLCVWRVIKRFLKYRGQSRPDLAEGCDEHLNLEFIKWVWDYPKRTRPKVLDLIRNNAKDKKVFRLRSRAEMQRFLDELEPNLSSWFSPV